MSSVHEKPSLANSEAVLAVALISIFWIYVTLSNVLYVRGLSAGIDPSGAGNYFASWKPRVLQHLFLYPLLLGCLWGSLHVGWTPLWRAIPAQLALSLVFSGTATPLLAIAENLTNPGEWRVPRNLPEIIVASMSGTRRSLWVAGTTNFELTYGFALALVTGFMLYRRFRDTQLRLTTVERAWSDARLEALRAQLSPHTLFNLLHTIRGQVAWNPAAAQAMIIRLGDLLRSVLVAGEREFSLLRDEVRFARLYLELQQQRFEDRIRLELPDPDTLPSAWVPSLVLQPLIENAVVHGLAGHDDPVTIRLQVTTQSDVLMLELTNDVAEERMPSAGAGIGQRNVSERLAVHFGERGRFESGLIGPRMWRAKLTLPLVLEQSRP